MASFQTLADAVVALKAYHKITGRDELLAQAITSAGKDSTTRSILFNQVMNVVDGGRRLSQIIEALQTFSSAEDPGEFVDIAELKEILKIYYDIESDFTAGSITDMTAEDTNPNPKDPNKSDSSVGIIQVLTANVTPASRFADASALMLTAIPTVEWSRAVPYLNVKMILPRPPLDGNNRPSALSLFKFLVGTSTISSQAERDLINASGVPTGIVKIDPETGEKVVDDNKEPVFETFTSTGMEIFTAPQTLVNADEGFAINTGTRHAPVIDRFRPMMTFKSLDFNVVPTHGMMSYKSGKLQFVLHDRSRMGEIADLIRPDLYSTVELLIEYGWSHPDGGKNSGNVYGQLLNNIRVKEKYGVMNSSFVFDEAGQVDVTLEIFMKGVTDFSTTKIAQSKRATDLIQHIELLTDAISANRAKTFRNAGTKEVRGTTILDSPSDTSSAMSLDDKSLKEIKKFISDTKNADVESDPGQLRAALVGLYGGDGTKGSVKKLDGELNKVYEDKLSSLRTAADHPLDLLEKSELKTGHVSLAKLFLRFVGEPLAATNKFDEVQILFYCFNPGAGDVRHENIGSFPIKRSEFETAFKAYTKNRGRFNVTIGEFVTWVSNNFIDDQANPAYGISGKGGFPSAGFDDKGQRKAVELDPAKKTALNTEIENRMREMGIEDGTFRMPQVDLYVESLPLGKGTEDSATPNGDEGVSLLRIHIFDKQSTPHMPLQQLLDAMMDKNLGTFAEPDGGVKDKAQHLKNAADIRDRAIAAGFLERIDSELDGKKTYRLSETANPRAIKNLVADSAPTLRFGTMGTGLKRVAMKSLHEPLLNTIHMQRAGLGDGTGAPGVDGEIVPMQMLPTELEMETFGCPLINFGQQFFIDMDTGTTVDNIYGVVGLTHRIEQGKFDSSYKLINIDAYGKYRSAINSIKAAVDELTPTTGEES